MFVEASRMIHVPEPQANPDDASFLVKDRLFSSALRRAKMLKPALSAFQLARLALGAPPVTPQIKTGLHEGRIALELLFQSASRARAWGE
jgi:hypothetical protein